MKKLFILMTVCLFGCSIDYPKHAVIGTGGAGGSTSSASSSGGAGGQ